MPLVRHEVQFDTRINADGIFQKHIMMALVVPGCTGIAPNTDDCKCGWQRWATGDVCGGAEASSSSILSGAWISASDTERSHD
jgi:hypothetical protein